jgi:hypothetical protein
MWRRPRARSRTESRVRYQRDAGFLRLEKRPSYGLSFIATYQFSKQLDDYSAPYGNQDFFHLRSICLSHIVSRNHKHRPACLTDDLFGN